MSAADELRAIAARLKLVADEVRRLQARWDEEFSRRVYAELCVNCARSLRAYGESPQPALCGLCYVGREDSDGERIPEEEDEEEEGEQEEEEEEEEDDEEEEEQESTTSDLQARADEEQENTTSDLVQWSLPNANDDHFDHRHDEDS